jgi:hypothetical protein
MPVNRDSRLRLTLDYLKILIWPAIIVSALIYFRKPLYNFVGNLRTVSYAGVTLNSGNTEAKLQPNIPPHADIWFSFQDASTLSTAACVTLGRSALENAKFGNVADNQNGIAYGYQDGYVGAVNCSLQRVAVITVAGPYDGLSNRHNLLDQEFVKLARTP